MNGKLAPDKEILLVEDNPDDAELTRIAFAETGGDYRLRVLGDGAEAVRPIRASSSRLSISDPIRVLALRMRDSWSRPCASSASPACRSSCAAKPSIARSGARRSCDTP